MSRCFISVGGTGQHVALALTRLVRLGMLRGDIQLLAIDPDRNTPLPQLLQAPANMSGSRHPLHAQPVVAPYDVSKVKQATFESLFVDPHHPAEQELFEAMFDAKMGSIPIHQGMFGTPCVGATVFAEGANTSDLRNLLAHTQRASSVFVCGSVVGGTGAGITHKLIEEVRRGYSGPIYGIFFTQWFNVSGGASTPGAINAELLKRNEDHGLKFLYEHTIPHLTASLVIGYPGESTASLLKPLTVNVGDMGEHPHFLHLAAARALVDLPQAHTAQRDVRAYAIAHDERNEDWPLRPSCKWETASDYSFRAVLRAHRVLDQILAHFLSDSTRQAMLSCYGMTGIRKIARNSDPWGPDLNRSIVENEKNDGQQRTFVEQTFAELTQVRAEIRFCLDWVEGIFGSGAIGFGRDELMTKLSQENVAERWALVRSIFNNHGLKPDPRPKTPIELARHMADVLLQYGLKTVPVDA